MKIKKDQIDAKKIIKDSFYLDLFNVLIRLLKV